MNLARNLFHIPGHPNFMLAVAIGYTLDSFLFVCLKSKVGHCYLLGNHKTLIIGWLRIDNLNSTCALKILLELLGAVLEHLSKSC